MHLFKSDDPRDELDKATRDELWGYAKHLGVIPDMIRYMSNFTWTPDKGFISIQREASQANVTHPEMANWLRNMGYTHMKAAVRVMGRAVEPTEFGPVEKMQLDNTHRQMYPIPETVPVDAMSIQELRKELKAMGLKTERRDNTATLRTKLKEAREQNPS